MGWSYYTDPKYDRDFLINKIKSRPFWSQHVTPIEHRVVGNNVWTLVEVEGRKAIALTIIKSGGRGEGYGYKGMDETFGPSAVNCPLALLNQADPPKEGFAVEWRKRVREWHNEQAQRKTMETGTRIRYCGTEYRLHSKAGQRRGWNVTRCADGAMFRMSAKQLNSSSLVGNEAFS